MGHSLADDDAFLDAGLQRVGDDDSDGALLTLFDEVFKFVLTLTPVAYLDGQIDRDTVKYTHFGGFDDEDNVRGF